MLRIFFIANGIFNYVELGDRGKYENVNENVVDFWLKKMFHR